MIQRIQSVFLLGATIFSILMILHPVSTITFENGMNISLQFAGFISFDTPPVVYFRTWPLSILMILTGAINLFTIFLYKKRVLQMRFCVYNIILTLGLAGMMFFYFFFIRNTEIWEGIEVLRNRFSYSIILPFVNIILIFQAFRAIRRDDLLIKSYDRLR